MSLLTKQQEPASFNPTLKSYLDSASEEFAWIATERRSELELVSSYVREQLSNDRPAKLTFICTHNSRRSHLSQLWAQISAAYYGVSGVETYSGGTEATALNPRAVEALRRCGVQIDTDDRNSPNPHYRVTISDAHEPYVCFSKVYNESPNPTQGYCAIMTCSQADDACPRVMGCDLRVPIRYEDPKLADDSDLEAATYDLRSRQICREMMYMISSVRNSRT